MANPFIKVSKNPFVKKEEEATPSTGNPFMKKDTEKPLYTPLIPEPSDTGESEVQLAQNTFDPNKNKTMSETPNLINAALRTGMATLAQFNRPYSAVAGALESGIKELVTPSTEEAIADTPYPERVIERVGGTVKEALKGGWEGLLSNEKGLTDPLKASVEVVRGPESKITGDPGIIGTVKDIASAEGLDKLRAVTDFVGAIGVPGVARGIDPLSYVKSVVPLSTTSKGVEVNKTRNLMPSVLERVAEGQQGFAPSQAGGPVEALTSIANVPLQKGAKAMLDAGTAIDTAPMGSWSALLKTPKTAFNAMVEAGKDAIFNRTGDPLKDAITEAGLAANTRGRSIIEEEMGKFIPDKEASLMGEYSQVEDPQIERALREGFQAAETPERIFMPKTLRPSTGMDSNLVPDYNEISSYISRRNKDRIMANESLTPADKDFLVGKLGDTEVDHLNKSAYQTSRVDRDIFDRLGDAEANMRYKSGLSNRGSAIKNIISVSADRPLRKAEYQALVDSEIFTTPTLDGMYSTADVKEEFLSHIADNAGEYINFQRVQSPDVVAELTKELKLQGKSDAVIEQAVNQRLANDFRDYVDTVNMYRNSDDVQIKRIGDAFTNQLFDRLKAYADYDGITSPYAKRIFKSQKAPAFDYVTHSLDPQALAVLENKLGEAVTPSSLAKRFSVDSKHSSDISRTYKDAKGNSYPVSLVNLANKVKNSPVMEGGLLPQELQHASEMFGFSPIDMDDLTKRLKNIYGDYTGPIFDTDPMRTVLTRVVRHSKAKSANEFFDTIEKMADNNRDPRLRRVIEGAEAPKGLVMSKHPELPDIAGTPEIISQIDKRIDSMKDIGPEKLFSKMYNEAMSLWKQSATSGIGIPRIAFSVTNLASEVYKNKQAGVDVGGQAYLDALKALSMEKGSKLRDLLKNHTIELPQQGGYLDGTVQPILENGIQIISKEGNGKYRAEDILALAKRHGVVDSGFAGQDISRVLESTPDVGKASFPKASMDIDNIDFTNPEALKAVEEFTTKGYAAQVKDFFFRNNKLPEVIVGVTKESLPFRLQRLYEPNPNKPGQWKLSPERDYGFDDVSKMMTQIEDVPVKYYSKTIEPLPSQNKWQRMLDAIKSPAKTVTNFIEQRIPKLAQDVKQRQIDLAKSRVDARANNIPVPEAGTLDKAKDVVANTMSTAYGLAKPVIEKGAQVSNLGADLARWSENYARMTNFIDKLKKGYSPKQAAKIVEETSFNYQDRSAMLDTARNIFPFATFTAKNLPFQMKQAVSNQKPLASTAQTLIALNSEPNTEEHLRAMPSYKKSNMPVRVPEWFRNFFDKDGMESFINIGRYIPSTQLGSLDPNETEQTVNNIIGSMGPYKLLFELMANKSSSTGQPIESFPGEKVQAIGNPLTQQGLTSVPAKAEYAARNLVPAYQQYESLTLPTAPAREGSLSLPERLMRMLTGVNISRESKDQNQVQRVSEFKSILNRLKSDLRRAEMHGNKFKAEQIEQYLNDPKSLESILDRLGIK